MYEVHRIDPYTDLIRPISECHSTFGSEKDMWHHVLGLLASIAWMLAMEGIGLHGSFNNYILEF